MFNYVELNFTKKKIELLVRILYVVKGCVILIPKLK